MRRRIGIIVAVLALLGAGTSFAEPQPILELGNGPEERPPPPGPQVFLSPSGQPFRAPQGEPYPVALWFAQADADHDGRLTRAEFNADADAWFKFLDANGDGRIDMIEVTHWEEAVAPEVSGPAPPSRRRDRPAGRNELDTRRQGASAYSLINEPHPIRGADADYSFAVSPTEWRAATARRFAALDPDGDGVLLLTDLKPTPAQAVAESEGKDRKPTARGSRR